MPLLRRPLHLAVQGLSPGLAYFHWKASADPVLERFEPHPPQLSWRLIRRIDHACAGVAGTPFVHLEVRTPYGDPITEEMVTAALREALGPKFDDFTLRGWHVAHLADTHLGSHHRVFASLARAVQPQADGLWDQVLPLELAVTALGDWLARTTGHSHFQLVMARGDWVYSLAYRDAQAYHLIRVAGKPRAFACQRVAEHRAYLQDAPGGGMFPVFAEVPSELRSEIAAACGGELQPLPSPPGYAGFGPGPDQWHFGLALASVREEAVIHNQSQVQRQDGNLEIRMWNRLIKTTVVAIALGATALCVEGWRSAAVGHELTAMRTQAALYSGKVSEIAALRRQRHDLLESLARLRPLWNRPLPVDRILQEIASALPPKAGLDGLLIRSGAAGTSTASFLGWVDDWNQIRPLQERLRKSPFFTKVELSDQRKDPILHRVSFHATCTLAEQP